MCEREGALGRLGRSFLLRRVHLRLIELEAIDLAPDVRPVALVERQEQRQRRVERRRQVAAHQLVREIAAAAVFQVHREECDVRGDVRVAKTLVEFDAIEDADARVLEAHRVGAQIAVAVARAALTNPRVEEFAILVPDALDERSHVVELPLADRAADERFGLLEILAPVGHRGVQSAERVDRFAPL